MPVFYYDHNGNLRVIPDAERDRPSGGGQKTVLHGRVHKGRIVESRKPNPNPPPNPSPRLPQPHSQPSSDPGGSKLPDPEKDPGKIISEAAKRLLLEWLKLSQVPASNPGIPKILSHSASHIPAPRHTRRPPRPLPKAEYRHPIDGKIDLWHKLEQGHVLEPKEAQQLFHVIDLQKYGAKTEQAKQDVEHSRQYAEEKLAHNMVTNAPKDKAGNVLLNGAPVPIQSAHAAAKANIQHFQQHDRYMRPLEMAEKVKDLIDEGGGPRYYKDSKNFPLGPNSMNQPIPLEKISPIPSVTPNILNYGYNAVLGQGQDVVVNIDQIEFSKDAEKLSSYFMGKEEFRNAYYKALQSNTPQAVSIGTVEVPTENVLGSAYTLGKVKLRAYGMLYKNAKGQVIFVGTVDQGSNAEVWTFPKGKDHKRDWKAEVATTVGRAIPFIQFRTIIKGQRAITFPVIVKP